MRSVQMTWRNRVVELTVGGTPHPGANDPRLAKAGGDAGHPQHAVRRERRRHAVVAAHHHRAGELAAQRLDLGAKEAEREARVRASARGGR